MFIVSGLIGATLVANLVELLIYGYAGHQPVRMTVVSSITSIIVAAPLSFIAVSAIHAQVRSKTRIAAMRDTLTERVADLASARTEAEKANKAKSAFLAQMSHELRTPLNAIMGFSEILKMRKDLFGSASDEQVTEYSEAIHSSGAVLLSLVNDLLDLAKIEAGKHELDREVLCFDEIVDELRLMMEPITLAKDQTLTILSDYTGLKFLADRRAANQILLNLLSNASKYSPDGSEIILRSEIIGNCLTFSVIDNGYGMAAREVEMAVKPFQQISTALLTSERGTGLGLPIVKSLITLEGGTLEIESTPRCGTTVTVRYPETALSDECREMLEAA